MSKELSTEEHTQIHSSAGALIVRGEDLINTAEGTDQYEEIKEHLSDLYRLAERAFSIDEGELKSWVLQRSLEPTGIDSDE